MMNKQWNSKIGHSIYIISKIYSEIVFIEKNAHNRVLVEKLNTEFFILFKTLIKLDEK